MKLYIVLLSLIAVIPLQGMQKKLVVKVGVCTAQNKRGYQEDRFVIKREDNGNVFLGVFDGHQGTDSPDGTLVSEYLKNNLYTHFSQASGTIGKRLQTACEKMNQEILNDEEIRNSGSTAIVAYADVNNRKIFFANVGDSQAVMVGNAQHYATIPHKPNNPDELARIKKAGGYVLGIYLNSAVSVSRAFGDYYVGAGLIATPDISEKPLEKGNILVLGSDGLFDVAPDNKLGGYVKNIHLLEVTNKVEREKLPVQVQGSKKLIDEAKALASYAATDNRPDNNNANDDNITVITARFIEEDDELSGSEIELKDDAIDGRPKNKFAIIKFKKDTINFQVSKLWNALLSITKTQWLYGSIVSVVVISGLVCCLKYLQ